jgi:hypothetical protein
MAKISRLADSAGNRGHWYISDNLLIENDLRILQPKTFPE